MGGLYTDRTFRRFDPEAMVDVLGPSHLEHRLIGAGRFAMRARTRASPRLQVDAVDYGCGVSAHGTLDSFRLTILCAPAQSGRVFVNGRVLPSHALQLHAEAAPLLCVSSDAAGWLAVSVSRRVLQAHASKRLGRELTLPLRGHLHCEPDPSLIRHIVDDIESAMDRAASRPLDADAHLALDHDLLDALTEALVQAPPAAEPRNARSRRRIVEAVETVACLGVRSADLDAAALSHWCAASERLVEQAMRQGTGMSPQRWLMLARLNRVYVELARPGNTRSVTDVAMHWGFNHLGRFASTYRAVFGEAPSETVARVRDELRSRFSVREPVARLSYG